MAFKLRPYQQKAVDNILNEIDNPFGSNEIILEAATSFGKSAVLSELAKRISGNVVILVTFTPLIDQIAEHLAELNVDHSILKAGRESEFDENHRVQLVMAQTYYARLDKLSLTASVVLMDERHVSYDTKRTKAILDKLNPSHIVGVSGTPYTSTGVKLNNEAEMIRTTSMRELTEQGYLSPLKYYVPKWAEKVDYSKVKMSGGDYTGTGIDEVIGTTKNTELIIKSMNQLNAKNKKTLVFCSTIEHCESITAALKADGYLAEAYHSKLNKNDSELMMNAFKNNSKSYLSTSQINNNKSLLSSLIKDDSELIEPREVKCLVSVSRLSIGFDAPDVELGVLLRKTTILSLVRQMIGRLCRKHPGKTHGEILDLSQSVSNHGFADESYDPPDDTGNPAENRTVVANAKEHLEMSHLDSFLENEEPQEITREFYDIKIEEVKQEEQRIKDELQAKNNQIIDVMAMKRVFDTTDSVATLITIGAHIWHMRFGDAISKAGRGYKLSPDWLAEDAVRILDEYPENHGKWMRSHRTRIRNILAGSTEDKQLSTKLYNGLYAKNYNGIKFFASYLEKSFQEENESDYKFAKFKRDNAHIGDEIDKSLTNKEGIYDIGEDEIPF